MLWSKKSSTSKQTNGEMVCKISRRKRSKLPTFFKVKSIFQYLRRVIIIRYRVSSLKVLNCENISSAISSTETTTTEPITQEATASTMTPNPNDYNLVIPWRLTKKLTIAYGKRSVLVKYLLENNSNASKENVDLMFTTTCNANWAYTYSDCSGCEEKTITCSDIQGRDHSCDRNALALLGTTASQNSDGFWETIQNCPQCGCDENGATPMTTLYIDEILSYENATQYEIDFFDSNI